MQSDTIIIAIKAMKLYKNKYLYSRNSFVTHAKNVLTTSPGTRYQACFFLVFCSCKVNSWFYWIKQKWEKMKPRQLLYSNICWNKSLNITIYILIIEISSKYMQKFLTISWELSVILSHYNIGYRYELT
jgi:hypothetical protein